MALAGFGGGPGKLRVLTRQTLPHEICFHAAGAQQLIHAAQLPLELLVIHVAQYRGQSWTQGGLEGWDWAGGRWVFHWRENHNPPISGKTILIGGFA
jgi:hypothetical protein